MPARTPRRTRRSLTGTRGCIRRRRGRIAPLRAPIPRGAPVPPKVSTGARTPAPARLSDDGKSLGPARRRRSGFGAFVDNMVEFASGGSGKARAQAAAQRRRSAAHLSKMAERESMLRTAAERLSRDSESHKLQCRAEWQRVLQVSQRHSRTMSELLSALQSWEEERCDLLKAQMRQQAIFESALEANLQYDVQLHARAVDAVDPPKDIAEFVAWAEQQERSERTFADLTPPPQPTRTALDAGARERQRMASKRGVVPASVRFDGAEAAAGPSGGHGSRPRTPADYVAERGRSPARAPKPLFAAVRRRLSRPLGLDAMMGTGAGTGPSPGRPSATGWDGDAPLDDFTDNDGGADDGPPLTVRVRPARNPQISAARALPGSDAHETTDDMVHAAHEVVSSIVSELFSRDGDSESLPSVFAQLMRFVESTRYGCAALADAMLAQRGARTGLSREAFGLLARLVRRALDVAGERGDLPFVRNVMGLVQTFHVASDGGAGHQTVVLRDGEVSRRGMAKPRGGRRSSSSRRFATIRSGRM